MRIDDDQFKKLYELFVGFTDHNGDDVEYVFGDVMLEFMYELKRIANALDSIKDSLKKGTDNAD